MGRISVKGRRPLMVSVGRDQIGLNHRDLSGRALYGDARTCEDGHATKDFGVTMQHEARETLQLEPSDGLPPICEAS